MRPISKSISYGYSKSVQLFEDELIESAKLGGAKKFFILVISERDINGELRNIAEYRYDDYLGALHHMHRLVKDFVYADLNQQ